MRKFLDHINFEINKIDDNEWEYQKQIADSLNLFQIKQTIKYLNKKIDQLDELIELHPYNELLEYNRSIVLLMAYELEMTAMCA